MESERSSRSLPRESTTAGPGLCRSLVVPMYHERDRIPATLKKLAGSPLNRADTELILVDDGSADGTAEVARQMVAELGLRAQVISAPHGGKGAAVARGVLSAEGAAVVFTDADLSAGLPDIVACFELIEHSDADVVAGTRSHPDSTMPEKGSLTRLVSSLSYNWMLRGLRLTSMRDTQCGLKGFDREKAIALFEDLRTPGFAFDIEILARAERMGFRVVELPVTWSHVAGSRVRVGRHAPRMVVDSVRIRLVVSSIPRQRAPEPAAAKTTGSKETSEANKADVDLSSTSRSRPLDQSSVRGVRVKDVPASQ